MTFGKRAVAHVCSVMIGSLLILIGVETIVVGIIGPISGLGKWIGGVLIFGILSVVSLPIGLVIRWLTGKLPLAPLTGSMVIGVFVGLGLMFVLHPGMYPPISPFTHPISLGIVHVMSGLTCGCLWYFIEFQLLKAVADG